MNPSLTQDEVLKLVGSLWLENAALRKTVGELQQQIPQATTAKPDGTAKA